jgi:CRP-like cAMP-binding protein
LRYEAREICDGRVVKTDGAPIELWALLKIHISSQLLRNSEIKLLSVINPGKIFGEISVIDNLPYSASLIAESDVIIVLMSRESFRQCIDERSIIGVRLLSLIARMLCERLRSSSGQLVDYIDV